MNKGDTLMNMVTMIEDFCNNPSLVSIKYKPSIPKRETRIVEIFNIVRLNPKTVDRIYPQIICGKAEAVAQSEVLREPPSSKFCTDQAYAQSSPPYKTLLNGLVKKIVIKKGKKISRTNLFLERKFVIGFNNTLNFRNVIL